MKYEVKQHDAKVQFSAIEVGESAMYGDDVVMRVFQGDWHKGDLKPGEEEICIRFYYKDNASLHRIRLGTWVTPVGS